MSLAISHNITEESQSDYLFFFFFLIMIKKLPTQNPTEQDLDMI